MANGRDDLQRVFLPIFNKILDLIEKQIEDVKARTNSPIKVQHLTMPEPKLDLIPCGWSWIQRVSGRIS
jgi:hypothetical protein